MDNQNKKKNIALITLDGEKAMQYAEDCGWDNEYFWVNSLESAKEYLTTFDGYETFLPIPKDYYEIVQYIEKGEFITVDTLLEKMSNLKKELENFRDAIKPKPQTEAEGWDAMVDIVRIEQDIEDIIISSGNKSELHTKIVGYILNQ